MSNNPAEAPALDDVTDADSEVGEEVDDQLDLGVDFDSFQEDDDE